ncbi:sugar ABC transporter substrate-binding protein [Pseudomonas sp. S25]|uniref:Sugar ABC transporter substrate-binding protein n=1 Tax=Pseudomonas maioricensis TaxID=1766623 RepID=A0ABS9ZQN2_9PSED|nr:FecR domain-containing protein [Pseudomonas sp. S25]MCI8212869.1 sugar ABC transporter substrate-binding protein [Pseudomonas sp. S25]
MSNVAQARQIAEDAAGFLVLLESGSASAEDRARLQRWREQSTHHEQTWQKAQGLRQRFSSLPPELAMASLDRPDRGRRSVMKRALIVAALLPAGWLLAQQTPVAALRADLRTASGGRRDLRLPDGSLLQLDTATALNMDLEQGRRSLSLIEGEMALNMASNVPAMTINTQQGKVLADGAELCVRQYGQSCKVSVWRGLVQLIPQQGPSMQLKAGQRATMSAESITSVQPFDTLQPGWRQGVLSVENQPLGRFLEDLSRYRPGILRWEPALESLKVTGTFRLDDTDKILFLLAASLPVQVQTRTRYWVTLTARGAAA